jgi:hypothetical protein
MPHPGFDWQQEHQTADPHRHAGRLPAWVSTPDNTIPNSRPPALAA